MDVLKVDEKNYVKASVIARELGYTADYVGQLCRGGKVDAKLFGRSWYVDRDSIRGHKVTRYRSTQAVTTKALKTAKLNSDEDAVRVPIHHSRFYAHSDLKPSPRYVPDEAELIPTVLKDLVKRGNVQIHLAEAEAVKVTSESGAYQIQTPKLAPIQFKGSLQVSDADSAQNLLNGEPGKLLHAKEVNKLSSDRKAINIAISPKPAAASTAFLEKVTQAGPKTDAPVHTIKVTSDEESEEQESAPVLATMIPKPIREKSSHTGLFLTVSTFASLAIVVLLLGLETHIEVTKETVVTSYEFTVDHLVATAYVAVEKF